MFVEEIRRAVMASPRGRLAEISGAVWKGFAAGAIGEEDAQQLAELIEAKKTIPAAPAQPRRRVGSRPRSPESMERRRRWTSSGWLPPQVAARFTMAENAVLAVIAAEVSRRGQCMLTIGAIAAQAGVCKSTVRNALRQAQAGAAHVRGVAHHGLAQRPQHGEDRLQGMDHLDPPARQARRAVLGGWVQKRKPHEYTYL